ncbi:MAG: autotransporter assembly complex protein TamA [Cellvibrionaceae bacterium]
MKFVYHHSSLYLLFALIIGYASPTYSATNLKINLEGITAPELNNVRQSLSIIQKSKELSNTAMPNRTILTLHKKAEKQIAQALRPFGFYEPTIEATLTNNNDQWTARYNIQAGPVTRINNIATRVNGPGKNEKNVESLLSSRPMAIGDTLNHTQYSQYKQQLFDALYEVGYLDVSYQKSELRVDIKQHQADILLELNTGEKYFFGEIDIKQNNINDKLIEKFITIDTNTPFNTNRLLNLQLRLTDSGYFSHIDIDVQREKTVNQRIPVVITAKPSKKLKYSTSIGYGTDTGPRAGISVLNRRVNRRGHNLQYSLRVSPVENNLSAKYIIPIGDIYTESLDFSATGDQQAINDTESIQYKIGTSLNQNRWGGRRQISLDLIQEDFSFDDEADQTSVLLIPGIKYSRKKADNTLFSRRGYSFSADLHGSSDDLLSEETFLYLYLSAKSIIPLGDSGRFLSRIEFGNISTDDFDELPPSQRFFTGGSQSVRGYGYKDIGEENSQGNNIGGQYLFTSSIEIDYLFYGNYGAALFYDIGDAANSRDFSLKTAAGLGFRYKSPIGMIRVDLAHPFDDPDENVRLHISIGPDL